MAGQIIDSKNVTGKRTVSIRKVEANRQNALKSTGPKTPRGKAYSGRNAIKHGLFSRQMMDFVSHGEDPTEYEEILNGLRAKYQPMGTAEELEVERIALCWWRLKRAWRYENAMNHVALRDLGRRELVEQAEWCKERDKEEDVIIQELQRAAEEIQETQEFPKGWEELKQRIFAIEPKFEPVWKLLESAAQERLATPAISKLSKQLDPKERSVLFAIFTVKSAVIFLEELRDSRNTSVREIAIAQHVIPNSDALDKVLRYETTIERQLGRSVDRLELLQRRRKGETLLPPVSVRLTRG
jgi:hypothetical protein